MNPLRRFFDHVNRFVWASVVADGKKGSARKG